MPKNKAAPTTPAKAKTQRRAKPNPVNLERFAQRMYKLHPFVASRAERRIYGTQGKNSTAALGQR